MRVRMLHGHEEQRRGGRLVYSSGLVYVVDDEQGRDWIKARIAVDESGRVEREDLLTPEEWAAEHPETLDLKVEAAGDAAEPEEVSELGTDSDPDPGDPS